jgi:Arc/MetJ-type ribon-helix-helix transcriptional regulator
MVMKKIFPILIILLLIGCKPKQIIQERVVTQVDSTAIVSLQQQVSARNIVIEMMRSEIEATREENVRLQGEVSKHEINYDTEAPVNPETGKYPIASEVITESRTLLEKSIKEFEMLKQEYRKKAEALTQKNSNLELTIELLRDENRELKAKITPTTGFNFKLFLAGISTGMILIIVLGLFIKLK